MQRVGQVVRISQGLVILKSDAESSGATGDRDDVDDAIGTMVLDDSLSNVGRVVDVFGPVDRPYYAVTTDDGVHQPSLVGTTLYAR
ncbi:H/ACA RNA-protein complex protein Gar1 [Halostagnicola larsenii XH-48]|uniref:H/ACA RNA-protein complex protein Gar1 n=1 Tax=Halostagnicola larsenii XH-48 TaxID=797299 RepID=W0JL33_9EURY|nr:Gar1/Naf1 family protein [Halostagnicola larsenii]AHF99455.1 H/ACA RNA-protein complex protein Gar1 [Halostagnicola larsenii XH-48]